MPTYLHHNNIDALLWLQTSSEWYAVYRQSYELAKLRIEAAVRRLGEGVKCCITSDLDETLFDNSAYNEWLVTSGRNFNETGSWDLYCREIISLPMPGVEEFYLWLATKHPNIRVFFVTSRLETLRAATAANLAKFPHVPSAGASSTEPSETSLFMKGFKVALPDGEGDSKYLQYKYIEEALGYTTLVRLGDNASDFHQDFGSHVPAPERLSAAARHCAEWGAKWIQFPNPVYGSFLLSLRNADKTAITEDEGTVKGMIDDIIRMPRSEITTPKVGYFDPWTGSGGLLGNAVSTGGEDYNNRPLATDPQMSVADVFDRADGTYSCIKDANSVFLWVSQTFADLVGQPKSALIGTRDSRAAHVAHDKAVMTSGRPLLNLHETIEVPDANGNLYPLEIVTQKGLLRKKSGLDIIGITVCFSKLVPDTVVDVHSLIERLKLAKTGVGGYFATIGVSNERVSEGLLPARFDGQRALYSSNYFLLEQGDVLRLHKLQQDEQWFYHSGSALRLHMFSQAFGYAAADMGGNPDEGQVLSFIVSHNCWCPSSRARVSGRSPP